MSLRSLARWLLLPGLHPERNNERDTCRGSERGREIESSSGPVLLTHSPSGRAVLPLNFPLHWSLVAFGSENTLFSQKHFQPSIRLSSYVVYF